MAFLLYFICVDQTARIHRYFLIVYGFWGHLFKQALLFSAMTQGYGPCDS